MTDASRFAFSSVGHYFFFSSSIAASWSRSAFIYLFASHDADRVVQGQRFQCCLATTSTLAQHYNKGFFINIIIIKKRKRKDKKNLAVQYEY